MGKFDKRHSMKMRQRVARKKKKARARRHREELLKKRASAAPVKEPRAPRVTRKAPAPPSTS